MSSEDEVGITPREEIMTLMMELSRTDYVVTKIAEAETVEEQQALRTKYVDILNQRKQWRARINELEVSE